MHKVAVLDMYDGTPNQGMRAIKELLERYQGVLSYKVFDVRGANEIPDLNYDIYISSGGPGSPLDGDGIWNRRYFDLIDRIFHFNKKSTVKKKYVFLICHSFQMIADHLDLGKISKRKSMSFGTFPVHKTEDAADEVLLRTLNDPFHVADFRHWQLTEPDAERFEAVGAKILAMEKYRPHVDLPQAIMMIRFSPEVVGTQFHPEADPMGMLQHFMDEERKAEIIKTHKEEKYIRMMDDLNHPEKIKKTYWEIIPGFLNHAIEHLMDQMEQSEPS